MPPERRSSAPAAQGAPQPMQMDLGEDRGSKRSRAEAGRAERPCSPPPHQPGPTEFRPTTASAAAKPPSPESLPCGPTEVGGSCSTTQHGQQPAAIFTSTEMA
eukprot:5140297-Prymnesium_polylepis.1